MKDMAKKDILKSLLDISSFTSFVDNPDLISSLIIEECVLTARAEWGFIVLYDSNFAVNGFRITKAIKKRQEPLSISIDKLVRRLISEKGPKTLLDDRFWLRVPVARDFKTVIGGVPGDLLLCPIKKRGTLLGLAGLISKKGESAFSKRDKDSFSIICQEASIVIDNINLFRTKLQSEKMAAIGQAISGIAHYVKNILQGLTTGSDLFNLSIKDEDLVGIKQAWAIMDKNMKRISELVMDMLYYSSDRKLQKGPVDLEELLLDVAALLKPRLQERKISLTKTLEGIPAKILLNENGIHRSILNIIANSIDACDKKDSSIKIETKKDVSTKSLHILISDNGKGISEEDIKDIFNPFFTKDKRKGTGIGLAITKRMIEDHDGTIEVASQKGKGTSFKIALPIRTTP